MEVSLTYQIMLSHRRDAPSRPSRSEFKACRLKPEVQCEMPRSDRCIVYVDDVTKEEDEVGNTLSPFSRSSFYYTTIDICLSLRVSPSKNAPSGPQC